MTTALTRAIAHSQPIHAQRFTSDTPATHDRAFDHYADGQPSEWLDYAACAGQDVDAFFPNGGRGRSELARTLCATCPVVNECLNYAMDRPWLAGVWGGMSAHQRRDIRRKDRKDVVA